MRKKLVLALLLFSFPGQALAASHPSLNGGDEGGGCAFAALTYIGSWDHWTWFCQNYGIIPGWHVSG